ncbi:MAG TPA: hypothetical protein VH120_01735 [Gemmataceae bacterium]|nr:hypothetical protein [Gemmataceae bacterium]
MDHKEQHHQHHEMEREERIREEKRHDAAELKQSTPIHPAWFFVVAAVLVALALAVWILVY